MRCESVREFACTSMILVESFHVMMQRMDARRRENTGLAHSAAQGLPHPTAPFDQAAGTDKKTADRGSESLG